MRLLRSSARPLPVDCFFCLSPSILPPLVTTSADRKGKGKPEVGSIWNWCCQRCGCWNIRDQNGDMVSDLPGMHNPTMNGRSFSLRATQSSSHFPSSSKSSPFCHNCLTNQTLIMNLLANYLPDDYDPTYQSLYDNLPSYLTSLHQRYPPVCLACQPAVEDALRKSDHRAQAEAWGSALQRGSQSRPEEKSENKWAVLVWRLRGGLWFAGTIFNFGLALLNVGTPFIYSQVIRSSVGRLSFGSLMMALNLLSILWIAWDPYWLRRVRSRAKVSGRGTWIRNMLVVYAIRLATSFSLIAGESWMHFESWSSSVLISGAILEVGLLLHSLISLRISQPVAIKLVRPVTSTSSPVRLPRPRSLPDLHEVVPQPTSITKPNPIFGEQSLQPRLELNQSEPMDWEPLAPDWNRSTSNDWDKFAVNKQRMFSVKQEETGLENLLAGWGLGTDERTTVDTSHGDGKELVLDQKTFGDAKKIIAIVRMGGAACHCMERFGMALKQVGEYAALISTPLSFMEIAACCLDLSFTRTDTWRAVGYIFMIIIRLAKMVGWQPVYLAIGEAEWWTGWTILDLISLYL